MAGRRQQSLPGTRVEPAPNSKYAPKSEMRLITRDYGTTPGSQPSSQAIAQLFNSWPLAGELLE